MKFLEVSCLAGLTVKTVADAVQESPLYSVDRDLTLIFQKSYDRLDDRTLAGSVRSEQNGKRSRFKCERYVIARDIFPVTFSYVFNFKHINYPQILPLPSLPFGKWVCNRLKSKLRKR